LEGKNRKLRKQILTRMTNKEQATATATADSCRMAIKRTGNS
jgi:hypothetical protein